MKQIYHLLDVGVQQVVEIVITYPIIHLNLSNEVGVSNLFYI